MSFSFLRAPIILLVTPFVFHSCSNNVPKEKEQKPEPLPVADIGYNFSMPLNKWALPVQLNEISGIVKLDGNRMLAIEDLHPVLYELTLDKDKGVISDTISFKETAKEKFDIEDVTMIGDTVYALWSHGALFKIKDWKNKKEITEIKTGLHKENNTEGLTYDPVTGNLLVACKNDAEGEDEKKSTRAIYEFDVKSETLNPTPFLLIHKKDLDKLKGGKIDFYPAAIAIHPINHDIYVISTRSNKCIVRFSHDGQLKAFEYLDKETLPQPEGICFDQQGNLYISTESRHGQAAYIYEYISK